MGRACSTHESEEKFIKVSGGKSRRKDMAVDGRIILQWISQKYDGVVDWINWLKKDTSSEIFLRR
jgi:hypothetical protein